MALGIWQVERRAWKLDLIAKVDARVAARASAAPGPAAWALTDRASDEYRHVRITGRFVSGQDTLVQAATERGAGFWVLTPLKTEDGWTVLVNRGFIPTPRGADETDASRADGGNARSAPVPPRAIPHAPPAGSVTVTGLLRMSEPGGAFLRHNVPAEGRWYSRDVVAIGAALAGAATTPGSPHAPASLAPYFIDAAAQTPDPLVPDAAAPWPIGGLTVVRFHNSHLVYALTWFGLALMTAWAGWRIVQPTDRAA